MDDLKISLLHCENSPSVLWPKMICGFYNSNKDLYETEESPEAKVGAMQHAYLNYLECKKFGLKCEFGETDKLSSEEKAEVEVVFKKVLEVYENLKKHYARVEVFFEHEVNLDAYLPNPSWGTLDIGFIGHRAKKKDGKYQDSKLYIIDAKFGYKKVQTVGIYNDKIIINPQLCAYWCGLYEELKDEHNITKGCVMIAQPKLHSFEPAMFGTDYIIKCMREIIAPAIFEITKGNAKYNPNLSNCIYCTNAAHCKHYHQHALVLKTLVEEPDMLSDEVIEKVVLPNVSNLKKYCDKVIAYCIKKAEEGKKWKGYSLVPGRPTRVFIDENKARDIALANGYDQMVTTSILSPAQAEKMMSKAKFSELLGDLVTYKPGKNTLVEDEPVDDKSSKKSLRKDFKENN